MRKIFVLISILVISMSCEKSITTPKPSATPNTRDVTPKSFPYSTPNPNITPIPTPTKALIEKSYEGYEKYNRVSAPNTVYYCEIPKHSLKLDRPVNIAIKKDASALYVMNDSSRLHFSYERNYKGKLEYIEPLNKEEAKSVLMSRSSVLKIDANKNISELNLDKAGLDTCLIAGEINSDENNNLYLADIDSNIYKLAYESILDRKYLVPEVDVKLPPPPFPGSKYQKSLLVNLSGLAIKDNEIYFSRFAESFGKTQSIEGFDKNYNYKLYTYTDVHTNNLIDIYKDNMYVISGYDYELFIYNKSFKDNGIEQGRFNLRELFHDSDFGSIYVVNTDYEYSFSTLYALRINSKGEVFISSRGRNSILKFNTETKALTLFAGNGKVGFRDGKGTDSEFNEPSGMAIDDKDNLYVADTGNNAIRKITPDGIVSTFYKESK